MNSSRSIRAAFASSLALIALIASGGTAGASGWTVTPVITGLDGPRGVAFDGHGNVYVSETGKFFPIVGTDFGVSRSGKVDRFHLGGGSAQLIWSTSFDSLYDAAHGAPEVLGPEGLSVLCTGAAEQSCHVRMIVSESKAGVDATTPGLSFSQIGHLFALNAVNGNSVDLSDVGDQEYAWANANKSLWEEFPDSNPYGVLLTKDRTTGEMRTFVVDAGANTVSEVMDDGTNKVIAFIPNDPVRDSTPTCATVGPDGALYVGTLDFVANLFVFGPGQSHVYRVDPNTIENPVDAGKHVWASGLTTITSCAFDSAGNFWGTEMFQPNGPFAPPGDLVRIPFASPSTHEHVGGGSLPLPGGVSPAADGSLYVSVNSANAAPGSGMIVRVAPA